MFPRVTPARRLHPPPVPPMVLAVLAWALAFLVSNLPAGSWGRVAWAQASRQTDVVEWIWSGALGTRSIRVNAKLRKDADQIRLLVSRSPDLENPLASEAKSASRERNNRVVSFTVTDLAPASTYFYAIEASGAIETSKMGRFRTLHEGPFSFKIAFGSCASTGSNSPVFDTIRQHEALFLVHLGDFHYENIRVNDQERYRRAFDAVLASPRQSHLYRTLPIVYLWDDHDFGGNNSDATTPGRLAARLTYQEYVPHYPLAAGRGDVPIYHAFSVGRVRFIVTDTRSERSKRSAPDDADKTMLGAEQKAWFKEQLLAAAERFPVIVWVNSVPWVAEPRRGADHWGGYTVERTELARFIEERGIRGLFILSGDGHMLALDDGSHSEAGIPVMHAAAFDRWGSIKGGPYSEGVFPGGGHFGLMTVHDEGGSTIEVIWSGRDHRDRELVGKSFVVPVDETLLPAH